MKVRLTITLLSVALAIAIGLCLFLSLDLRHSASAGDSLLSFDQPLSRLELCDPYFRGDYDLTHINVGDSVHFLQFPLIEAQIARNAMNNQIIYSLNGQRAIVYLDPDNTDTVVAYAVFDENRRPIKCDLTTLYDTYPCQLVHADLAEADFAQDTRYDLYDQYSFARYNDSNDSTLYSQSVILSDGRILLLEGAAINQTELFQSFCKDHPEAARQNYTPLLTEKGLHIGADTCLTRVRILDIFRIPEGTVWSLEDADVLYRQSPDRTDRRNSDYFLRWIQEHIPEGMTSEEVDRWIEDYRANNPE